MVYSSATMGKSTNDQHEGKVWTPVELKKQSLFEQAAQSTNYCEQRLMKGVPTCDLRWQEMCRLINTDMSKWDHTVERGYFTRKATDVFVQALQTRRCHLSLEDVQTLQGEMSAARALYEDDKKKYYDDDKSWQEAAKKRQEKAQTEKLKKEMYTWQELRQEYADYENHKLQMLRQDIEQETSRLWFLKKWLDPLPEVGNGSFFCLVLIQYNNGFLPQTCYTSLRELMLYV